MDPDASKIALANQCITNQNYPAQRPEFIHQSTPNRLPLEDGSAGMVLLFDQIEKHPNPVALLREAHRVLKDNGILVIVTPRFNQATTVFEADRFYRPGELLAQVQAVGGWQPLSDPRQGEPNHPLFLVAKRIVKPERPSKDHSDQPESKSTAQAVEAA